MAVVGRELVLELRASDPDGDDLEYNFSSQVPDIEDRATMTRRPDGSGVFRWTPQASDVSDGWAFDFTVRDPDGAETVTIAIAVRSDIGSNTSPIFREPLGTGTIIDLEQRDCLEVNVVVDDADSSSVMLSQQSPGIDGATLRSGSNGLSGMWSWCPSRAQIDGDDRYMLTLAADDLQNPPTLKNYLIVLRRPQKPDCPGGAPVVEHVPADESTLVNLTVTASITDDQGLKSEPLFYYSTTPPASPPDLAAMTQLSMVLLDGDMQDGTWGADVPNPAVGLPAGSSAELYYVIVASDNDDADGNCDHLTQAPASGAYQMRVTNPGGAGGAAVCETCSADVQCGGANDLCVRVGAMAEAYCLEDCTTDADCGADYTCSSSPVESVGGTSRRQCVPRSGSCEEPAGICMDDVYEDNDSREQAAFIAPGEKTLVSCPIVGSSSDDEDWFEILNIDDAEVTFTLAGGDASDLDLALYDAEGNYVASSVSLTSMETLTRCLEAGTTYFVRVHAYGADDNPYTLTYAETFTSCGEAPVCEDDAAEDDDTEEQARPADISTPFTSETNAICADDDDWYAIVGFSGETVVVDLTFEQTSITEDLDLHFHDAAGADLTPCTEAAPSTCTTAQGQSATSNEHYEHTIGAGCEAGCTFYVRVHGWKGAENLYDIRIALAE